MLNSNAPIQAGCLLNLLKLSSINLHLLRMFSMMEVISVLLPPRLGFNIDKKNR